MKTKKNYKEKDKVNIELTVVNIINSYNKVQIRKMENKII